MEFLESASGHVERLWSEATAVWLQGGWTMVAIAVIALGMFGIGVRVQSKLRQTGFLTVPEKQWRRWLDHPAERRGPIGRLLDEVTSARTIHESTSLFDHVRASETAPFDRDLKLMKVCVGAAPLVGLLGTVIGMLATFGALSSGAGGDKTMSKVAAGISEALITTETGLVIALPGLFFQYQLARKLERFKAFLAHVETVCSQRLHLRDREQGRARIRRIARAHVARTLYQRVHANGATRARRTPVAT